MPKIIKDIEETIIYTSLELFGKYGYDGVDMKMISQKCGIAVGTLYNYYPNKMELFFSVFEKSWHKTFKKLEDAQKSNLPPKELLKNYIKILYDDIKGRKGIGRELLKNNSIEPVKEERIAAFKEQLMCHIESTVNLIPKSAFKNKEYDTSRRLAEIFTVIITVLIDGHSDEDEYNIDFIETIIDSL